MKTIDFYKKVLILVIPISLQKLINVAVSSTDIIMLGRLNETAMSAVSIANQFSNILMITMFGLASGANVLNSQYWGKKNIRAIEAVLGMTITVGVLIGLIFTILGIFLPKSVMSIFTNNKTLVDIGSEYMILVSMVYIVQVISSLYFMVISSMEIVVVATITYAISFLINVSINYCLIFGKLGFNSLGAKGAAIGTIIARIFELLVAMVYAYKIRDKFVWRIRDSFLIRKDLFCDFIRYATPIVINEILWSIAFALNTAIYGHINENVVAANSVAQVTRQLFMILAFGLASAASILVGKSLGARRLDEAKFTAKNLIKITMILSIAMSILLFIFKDVIITTFALSEKASTYLNEMIIILCFYTIAQSFSAITILGIFRAGGDAVFGMYIDVCSMWFGSILLGSIGAFIFHLPVEVVIIIVMIDEFIKLPICIYRYRQKKWLKDITREEVFNE